jgi:hypothetical protein
MLSATEACLQAGFGNLISDRNRRRPIAVANQGRTKRARIADAAPIEIRSHRYIVGRRLENTRSCQS